MWTRLIADFRNGSGLASSALIVVWLALGAGLLWLGWNMGMAGIEAHSGIVKTVAADPKFGMHVTIDSSSTDFFFDNINYPQFPDIRVGDHVDILTLAAPEEWSADAAQSQRGIWIAQYGDQIAPFTPTTWPLHEALRWSALILGAVLTLFGVATLIRWVPSGQRHLAPIDGTSASEPESAGAASSEVAPPQPAQALDTGELVERASPPPLPTVSDSAKVAVWVGAVTVIALPIIEVISNSAAGRCVLGAWWAGWILVGVPIALAIGGITTLVLASTSTSGSPQRTQARTLGIVAIAMALAGIPINFMVAMGCMF